jgi:hypothetical protein
MTDSRAAKDVALAACSSEHLLRKKFRQRTKAKTFSPKFRVTKVRGIF